jgi:hypothetical protein
MIRITTYSLLLVVLFVSSACAKNSPSDSSSQYEIEMVEIPAGTFWMGCQMKNPFCKGDR